jgi:V/A-type H+-transporting ATPase subunit E
MLRATAQRIRSENRWSKNSFSSSTALRLASAKDSSPALVEKSAQGILTKMIIEVAGRNNLCGEENIEVILPRQIIGVEDLCKHPEELKEG